MFFKPKPVESKAPSITEEELIEYLKSYLGTYKIEWHSNIIDSITLEIVKRVSQGRMPTVISDALVDYYRTTHQLPTPLVQAVSEHIALGILPGEMVDAIQIFIDDQYREKMNTTIH